MGRRRAEPEGLRQQILGFAGWSFAFVGAVELGGEIMDGHRAECGAPSIRVIVREVRGAAVVGVFGEVDLATVDELRAGLYEAAELAEASRRVVVDLRGTEFIEVMGLKALLAESERLRLGGGELCLVLSESGQVSRIVETIGFDEDFIIYEDLALATRSG